MNTSAKRILLNFIIVISLLSFPWWFTALLVIAGIVVFDWFFEALAAGFVMDSLYAVPTSYFHGLTFVCTLSAALVLAGVLYVKPMLR